MLRIFQHSSDTYRHIRYCFAMVDDHHSAVFGQLQRMVRTEGWETNYDRYKRYDRQEVFRDTKTAARKTKRRKNL